MEQTQDPIWKEGYQAYEYCRDFTDNPYYGEHDSKDMWLKGWVAARNHYYQNMDLLRGWCDQEEPIDNQ